MVRLPGAASASGAAIAHVRIEGAAFPDAVSAQRCACLRSHVWAGSLRMRGRRSDVEAGRGMGDVKVLEQGFGPDHDQQADAAIAIPSARLLDLQAGRSAAGAAGTLAEKRTAGRVGAAIGRHAARRDGSTMNPVPVCRDPGRPPARFLRGMTFHPRRARCRLEAMVPGETHGRGRRATARRHPGCRCRRL